MWEQLPLLAFRIWPWRYCAVLTHLISFLFFFTILLFKLCIFVAKSEYCQFFESIVENISESWYIVIFLIIVKSSILIWDFWKLLVIWRYYQEETCVQKRRKVGLKRIYFIFYPALAAQWCSIDILLTAPLPPSGHIWILSPPVPSPNANPIICFSASELVYLKKWLLLCFTRNFQFPPTRYMKIDFLSNGVVICLLGRPSAKVSQN